MERTSNVNRIISILISAVMLFGVFLPMVSVDASAETNYSKEYFGQQLSGDTKVFYNAMKKAPVADGKTEIVVELSNINFKNSSQREKLLDTYVKQAKAAYWAFEKDYPSVFWYDNTVAVNGTYVYYQDGSGYWSKVKLVLSTFNTSILSGGAKKASENFNKKVNSVSIKGETNYEKLRSIYQYAAGIVTYGHKDDLSFSAYGSLINGKAMCEGYAKLIKVLCDKAGIPCVLINGKGVTNSGTANHMWNAVQMENGKWYGMDLTWDDQSNKLYYENFLSGSETVASSFGSRTFAQAHLASGSVSGVTQTFTYPTLNKTAYNKSDQPAPLPTPSDGKGDVNLDGKVSMIDVMEIQKAIAGLKTFSKEVFAAADVNNDGKLNMRDLLLVQKYVARVIVKF